VKLEVCGLLGGQAPRSASQPFMAFIGAVLGTLVGVLRAGSHINHCHIDALTAVLSPSSAIIMMAGFIMAPSMGFYYFDSRKYPGRGCRTHPVGRIPTRQAGKAACPGDRRYRVLYCGDGRRNRLELLHPILADQALRFGPRSISDSWCWLSP
jgi:hypothetical protein